MMTLIEGISFEVDESGVRIEQHDGCGNPVDAIYLHRVLLAHLAGEMGLIGTSDPATAITVLRLQRRLLVIKERCQRLDYLLALCGDREDLSTEQAQMSALHELVQDYCSEFDGSLSAPEAGILRTDTGHPREANAATVTSPLANSADAVSTTVANGQHKASTPKAATAQLELESAP